MIDAKPSPTFWARAPASTMLFGEHAVLKGYVALVLAMEPSLEVRWRWREDQTIKIEAMGQTIETSIDQLEPLKPLKYIHAFLTELYPFKAQSEMRGVEIKIDSAIDPTLGFGSSAALLIALHTVKKLALEGYRVEIDPLMASEIHLESLALLHKVQGYGSGADLAASLYGGVIAYWATDSRIERLEPFPIEMELIYCGYKRATGEILAMMKQKQERQEIDLDQIEQLGKISEKALESYQNRDPSALKNLALAHQGCMRALGLSDPILDAIEKQLDDVQAVKISGSGLGDCLVTWGLSKAPLAYRRHRIQIAANGVTYGVQ